MDAQTMNAINSVIKTTSKLIFARPFYEMDESGTIKEVTILEARCDNAGTFMIASLYKISSPTSAPELIKSNIFFPISEQDTETIIKTFEARNGVK
jgi:hypothetical protein